MSRTARTYLLFATFAALLVGVVAGALSVMPPLPVASTPASPVLVDAAPSAADGVAFDRDEVFLAALLGADTGTTAGHAAQLLEAAQLTCEWLTAGVPVVDISTALSAEVGLSDEEGRLFVAVAADTYCAPIV